MSHNVKTAFLHAIFEDMMVAKSTLWIMFFSLMLLLTGCGDPIQQQIDEQIPITEQRISALAKALENKQVKNANLIMQYAKILKQKKPELTPLIDELSKDATTEGPMFKSLQDRLNTVRTQPQMFASKQAIFDELLNIYQAADPVLFSDALSDPLNVLADMSDGTLPRVNALPKSQTSSANHAQNFGNGEQLIGNPNYGHWTTGSNGMSFWEWYGMYAMFDNLFGNRRVYYNDWGRNRNYSYYNDYGRTRYSSPSQLRQQTQLDNRTKKSFSRQGKKFTSAYSKNRTGAAGLSSQSRAAQTSASKFRQKSSFNSKYSRTSSSFRNSRTNTSRGFRRGK